MCIGQKLARGQSHRLFLCALEAPKSFSTEGHILVLAEGTMQKPESVLPRLLEVVEDRLPGSPSFGETSGLLSTKEMIKMHLLSNLSRAWQIQPWGTFL